MNTHTVGLSWYLSEEGDERGQDSDSDERKARVDVRNCRRAGVAGGGVSAGAERSDVRGRLAVYDAPSACEGLARRQMGIRTDEVRAAGVRDVALGVRGDEVGECGFDDVVPLLSAVRALDALRDVRHARGDDLVHEGLEVAERERPGDRLEVRQELGWAERIISRAADRTRNEDKCVSASRAAEHAMQREYALLRAQDFAHSGVELLHDGRQLSVADAAQAQRAELGLAAGGKVAGNGGECGVRASRGLAHARVPAVKRVDEGSVVARLQDREQARGVEARGARVGEQACECRLTLS